MKKTASISLVAAMILAFPAATYAQTSTTTTNTNSATKFAPGQQDRSKMTEPGVSGVTPGHKMQSNTTGSVSSSGASSYAPGQKKKLPLDTTHSSTKIQTHTSTQRK